LADLRNDAPSADRWEKRNWRVSSVDTHACTKTCARTHTHASTRKRVRTHTNNAACHARRALRSSRENERIPRTSQQLLPPSPARNRHEQRAKRCSGSRTVVRVVGRGPLRRHCCPSPPSLLTALTGPCPFSLFGAFSRTVTPRLT